MFFGEVSTKHIETINVFKEYVPEVANSIKISQQPIFNDTLQSDIITYKSILNQKLFITENLLWPSPMKFRFKKI